MSRAGAGLGRTDLIKPDSLMALRGAVSRAANPAKAAAELRDQIINFQYQRGEANH